MRHSFQILNHEFDKSIGDKIKSNKFISDLWPLVYIISDGKNREAYILRSKAQHIIENETCSKYFFNLEKQRAKNKLWTQIKTEKGDTKYGINAILSEQVNYYSTLFKSEQTNPNSVKEILTNINKKLTDSEITHLMPLIRLKKENHQDMMASQ